MAERLAEMRSGKNTEDGWLMVYKRNELHFNMSVCQKLSKQKKR
jgi:hypothetical protein